MKRFLPPDYADGISAPRASITGRPLPTPRAVSAHVHKVSLGLSNFFYPLTDISCVKCVQDEGFHDHAVTVLLVVWGQFIDHDITLTSETRDPRLQFGELALITH